MLWRDERVWDGSAGLSLTPASATVRVRLGTPATVERATVAAAGRSSVRERSLSVEVPADDTVVLGIRPGG